MCHYVISEIYLIWNLRVGKKSRHFFPSCLICIVKLLIGFLSFTMYTKNQSLSDVNNNNNNNNTHSITS
jgi:hypothetical protein